MKFMFEGSNGVETNALNVGVAVMVCGYGFRSILHRSEVRLRRNRTPVFYSPKVCAKPKTTQTTSAVAKH